MRIGYMYDFEAYPTRGGNNVHAFELAQGFIKNNHIVSVVDDSTMPGVTNYNSTTIELKRFIKNIDVLYVRIDARFTRKWKALEKCMNLAGDIPVVWEINAPANESLAYSWLGGKTGQMGSEGIYRKLRRWVHAVKKIPGIFIEENYRRNLAKRVSCAICVSKSLGNYAAHGLNINDVMILPNGGPLISEEEIKLRQKKEQHRGFNVLYSGSAIYPWQGLDYLFRVIELAKKEAPDITFTLAVNQKTADLPNSDNVIILEHLNRDQILDAICASDACVSLHPEYPWSKYNFHNSPMKLFEYMACMRPVVTSNHNQMKDIINDGVDGLLCSNESHDILNKLLYLRDNPDESKMIGHKAWERIQSEFNWPRNVTETLAVFERISEKSV